MRRPSGRMLPNTATITYNSFGQDSAAGRAITPGATTAPVRCAVQPDDAELFLEHLREQSVVYYVVKFYDDPSLRGRDQVNWAGRVLVVVGVKATSGGAGRTWLALCEERKPGG